MESKVVERIRRCLALARSAEGTPEGDVAMERAMAIARAAGVDIASIEVNPIVGAQRSFYTPTSISMWKALLAWEVAKYAGIEMLRDKEKWHLIGRPQDVDTWRGFYHRAEREIDEEAKKYIATYGGGKSEGDTFRKSAASGFGERLARYKKECAPEVSTYIPPAGGTMLVMTGRALEVRSLKEKLYPNTRTVSVGSKGSNSARAAGYQFGNSMGVHRGNLK
jgi:hypothetical protein